MTLYYDRKGKPLTLHGWVDLFENDDYKRVAMDELPNGITVSTVWLGLDHGCGLTKRPLTFETAVFYKSFKNIGNLERYPSEDEARFGHELIVRRYQTFKTAEEVLGR